jgi:hypothetical protein
VVVSGDELNDGVAPIVRAERQTALVGARREIGTVTLFGGTYETGALSEEDAGVFAEVTLTDLVDLASGQRCSSKKPMAPGGATRRWVKLGRRCRSPSPVSLGALWCLKARMAWEPVPGTPGCRLRARVSVS